MPCAAALIKQGLFPRSQILESNLWSILQMGTPFYAVMILYLRFASLNLYAKAVALVGLIALASYAVAFQSRLGCLEVGLGIVFSAVLTLRIRGPSTAQKAIALSVPVVILALVTWKATSSPNFDIKTSATLTVERWVGEDGTGANLGTDARWKESQYVLGEISPLEYLTGRGIAGTWHDETGIIADNPVANHGSCWICALPLQRWDHPSSAHDNSFALVLERLHPRKPP